MTPDHINASFEFISGFFLLLNCYRIWWDRRLAGYSVWAGAYFWGWGVWNVYYYPHLGQWWSAAGGVFILVAHTAWMTMVIRLYLQPVRVEDDGS